VQGRAKGLGSEVPQRGPGVELNDFCRINFATTWKNMAPFQLFQFAELKPTVYAFRQLPFDILLPQLKMLDCILCGSGLVENYHEREIKYYGLVEGPLLLRGLRTGPSASP